MAACDFVAIATCRSRRRRRMNRIRPNYGFTCWKLIMGHSSGRWRFRRMWRMSGFRQAISMESYGLRYPRSRRVGTAHLYLRLGGQLPTRIMAESHVIERLADVTVVRTGDN